MDKKVTEVREGIRKVTVEADKFYSQRKEEVLLL